MSAAAEGKAGVLLRKRTGDEEVAARGAGKRRKGNNKFQKPADTLKTDGITFAKSNSAPQLVMSKDFKEVTGEKGYRMARTAHGVSSGNWYWECEVLQPEKADSQAHWRLGWSQRQGDQQAPVGYDRWSYAYRDIDGSKVHESMREDGWGEAYGPGDVIGFMICLPQAPDNLSQDFGFASGPTGGGGGSAKGRGGSSPPKVRDSSVSALGNHIRFFKNGKEQGVAFTQIPPGTYFPAVSMYMGARIRANFGPDWIREPTLRGVPFRPISDLQEILVRKEEQDPQAQLLLMQQQALRTGKGRRNLPAKARMPIPSQQQQPPPETAIKTEGVESAGAGEEMEVDRPALGSNAEQEAEKEDKEAVPGDDEVKVDSSSSPVAVHAPSESSGTENLNDVGSVSEGARDVDA